LRKEHFFYKAEHGSKTTYLYTSMELFVDMNANELDGHMRKIVEAESGIEASALIPVTREEYMNNRNSWFAIR
jgi:hypothetical protein